MKEKLKNFGKNNKGALPEVVLFVLDILYNAVVIIALVVLIRSFLVSPFRVIGSSMADTLENNEFILIDKLSYHLSEPRRGDSVVFFPPITNKNHYKFQMTTEAMDQGIATLKIDELSSTKDSFYCKNSWVKAFWFCLNQVEENDLIYYQEINSQTPSGTSNANWEKFEKKRVTKNEISKGVIQLKGEPKKSYLVRIYGSNGPDYFVKRIIGIPGDQVRIENGKVYLKKKGEKNFLELEEPYLNDENKGNTFFGRHSEIKEVEVPREQYFVMGDNRNHSNDSRHWFSPIDEIQTPFVRKENISGKVLVVLWPPQNLRLLENGILEKN